MTFEPPWAKAGGTEFGEEGGLVEGVGAEDVGESLVLHDVGREDEAGPVARQRPRLLQLPKVVQPVLQEINSSHSPQASRDRYSIIKLTVIQLIFARMNDLN